jgi:tRNA G46 methylase TrmB
MTLQSIDIPDSIKQLPHSAAAAHLIDLANERIEAFMLAEESVTDNFVTCDFHLLDQALTWIEENHLLTGNRFCEIGSGFGVAALLASMRKMQSVGIEVEANLVEQATNLASDLDLPADFYCGSFVPRDIATVRDLASEVEHVETHEGDIYEEIGLGLDDFDLFFAFPWPGEYHFFEAVFEAGAATNSLLLTYRGRNGMHLLRKV